MSPNEFSIKFQGSASCRQPQNNHLSPLSPLPDQGLKFIGNRQTHLTPLTRMGNSGTNLNVFERRHF